MGTISLEILTRVLGIGDFTFFIYVLIDILTGSQPSLYSNFKYSQRQMRKKVKSKKEWSEDEHSTHDIELTFESFKRFVSLNPEGWTWEKDYGIYDCNPTFQPPLRPEFFCVRFKTYKDYVKAVVYWEARSKLETKRNQELAEIKNMAEFLAIQKQRAKEAEEQAARQMRESEGQIMEILKRLKNESVTPILTPSASVSVTNEGKTITLSGLTDMYR